MALKENAEQLTNRKKNPKDERESKEKKQEDHLERQIIYEPLLTVDQLSSHRKKKPALALPMDNLHLPVGSLKALTSEYQRCFKKHEPNLASIPSKMANRLTSQKLEGDQKYTSEYNSSYTQAAESFYRPQLIRRCTNLKLEGDHYHVTHYKENFIAYLLQKKAELRRTATTLKLLGKMNLETENRRNFILYRNVFRPPLCKKLTNLHLSGSLHMDTENRDKFLRYAVERQHPLKKIPTNLHLEGTFFLEPEYTSAFVEYKNYERSKPSLPIDQIKSPIDFIDDSDSSENLKHPLIPHLRSYLLSPSDIPKKSTSKSLSGLISRPPSRNSERFLDVETDTQHKAGKRICESPTTVMVKSSEPKIIISKPSERSSRSRWSSKSRSASPKLASPVYFSKEKAKSIAKSLPTLHKSNNWRSKACSGIPDRPTPASPQFDGRFECQPEYRKAYLNYIIRERISSQPDAVNRDIPERKCISTKENTHSLSPNLKHIGSRNSSPNVPKHPQKGLDLLETAAFGRRCRNESTSEMSASDGFSSAKAKKSLIPRSTQKHTIQQKNPHDQQEESESEPAFVVIE